MSALRIYTSSLVPYKDFKTEGPTLMIAESGHINCAMSRTEVRELRKSVLPCLLLLAYNRFVLSAESIGLTHQMIASPTFDVYLTIIFKIETTKCLLFPRK